MASRNWIELAALLLIIAIGLILWRVCARKLKQHDGFGGIVEEKGRPPMRRRMDTQEEIEHLEDLLDE